MARPYSEGRLQYFPMDCVMNDAMKLLEAEFGLTAFAVVVKLWQKIYAGRGYYCEWTREFALVFSQEVGVGANVVSEILSSAFKRGIFDRDLFDKYSILTSDGIQKRYFEAVKRRKRIEADSRFLLVKVAQMEVNADNNPVNADNNSVNADDNPQSKVNESKVNKSILESRVVAESDDDVTTITEYLKNYSNVSLSTDSIEALIEELGDVSAVMHYIRKLSEFIKKTDARIKNHFSTILKWHREDTERALDAISGNKKGDSLAEMRNINMRYLQSLKDEVI